MFIFDLFKKAIALHASDLHLSTGLPPKLRIDGDIATLDSHPPCQAQCMEKLCLDLLNDEQIKAFRAYHDIDFALTLHEGWRCRANFFHHEKGQGACFRFIPSQMATLESIQAPPIFKSLAQLKRGLILFTGASGAGKTTSMAAVIHHINQTQSKHIIMLEDPIEFLHEPQKSLIHQREIARHTVSFHQALRSALREDPDVILLGEMRDPETIRLTLTAAETGHLVFSTLHTQSATQTIHRILDTFQGSEKKSVQNMLSHTLQAVVSQTLIKKIGGSRICASEILVSTPAIRHLIREDKINQIYALMQTGKNLGMRTLEQHLVALLHAKIIEPETCLMTLDDFR